MDAAGGKANNRPLRLLFVAPCDVSTAQGFMATVARDPRYRILVFDSGKREPYPPQPWRLPTFSAFRSSHPDNGIHRWLGLPSNRYIRFLMLRRPALLGALLWLIIKVYRPDLVHSIGLNPEASVARWALDRIPKAHRPRWVASTWSNDIFWDRFRLGFSAELKAILARVDWLIADCRRDLHIAMELGLSADRVLHRGALPGIGQIHIPERQLRKKKRARPLLLLPKAYDGVYHKPQPMLAAIESLLTKKVQFDIEIVGAQEDVRIWIRLNCPALSAIGRFHDYMDHQSYLEMLGSADIVLAPSLTDGTPNALLEAMAYGAFPIFSNHTSISEWIVHGKNGFVVDPVDCRDIAQKLERAIANRTLRQRASSLNRGIVSQHCDGDRIRSILSAGYNTLLAR